MKKKNILFIALASTLVVSIFVYWKYLFKARETSIKTQNVETPEFGLNSFRSDNLDFTVYIIPQRFEIKEGLSYVEFRSGEGVVDSGRNDATGFEDLNGYLTDLDEINKTKDISEIRELEINGYPTRVRDEVRGLVKFRMYYIYVDDWVYVFSTKSESLYSDLDQIAQSFRYTP